MPFFRVFQHLAPRAAAWRTTIDKTLRQFFEGLAAGAPTEFRGFVDEVWDDAFPATARTHDSGNGSAALEEWERFYGISPNPSESVRRTVLAAEWAATGGQSPSYIQGVLQTAGFDVYVHEWWSSGPDPYVSRDPRDYTVQPLIGTYQCTAFADIAVQPQCSSGFGEDGGAIEQPQCDAFLINDPRYFSNLNLTRRAPPPIPVDPSRWRYFLYIGHETFPDDAVVLAEQRPEFERLIQKLKPADQWIVTLLTDYLITEAGDPIMTEGDDYIVV